jgi:hypothetical protein
MMISHYYYISNQTEFFDKMKINIIKYEIGVGKTTLNYIRFGCILMMVLFALFKIWKDKREKNTKKPEAVWVRPLSNETDMDENKKYLRPTKSIPEYFPMLGSMKRDMSIFKSGQMIRHKYRGDTWIGVFNEDNLTIRMDDEDFYSASGFAKRHIEYVVRRDQIGRKAFECNGWKTCQILVAGNWMTLDEYSKLLNC